MTTGPVDPGPGYRPSSLSRAGEEAPPPWGALPPETLELSASLSGLTLACRVDLQTHRILAVRHEGAPSQAQRGLYRALADAMTGWSIQDASEHALIRTENLLRDRGARPPVAGILQPENVDPCFALPLALVREVYAQYRRKTGYVARANYEDAPAARTGSEWGTSTLPDRIQRIEAAIPEICPETGIRKDAILVKEIAAGRKVTVEVRHPDATMQQRFLTRLEMDLRARLDPRIELFLEDRADANSKRQKEKR